MADFNYFDDFIVAKAIKRLIFKGHSFLYETESDSVEFLRKGSFVFQRNDEPPNILHGPCLFWMRMGNLYRITDAEAEQEYCEHFCVDFRGPRGIRIINALDQIGPQGYLVLKNTEPVTEIFTDILKSYRSNEPDNKAQIAVALENLMMIVMNELQPNDKIENDVYDLHKLAAQIRSDPFHEYDFSEIAKQHGLTYDHFRKLFREKYGTGLWHYQNDQKMIRAEELLLKSDLRIKEIAYTCGFQSDPDFTRSFTKHFGLSPKAYRDKMRAKSSN